VNDTYVLSLHSITMILLNSAVADSPHASFFDCTNWGTFCLYVFMSLFHPMDHYNDTGRVNTNVTLQLNV